MNKGKMTENNFVCLAARVTLCSLKMTGDFTELHLIN